MANKHMKRHSASFIIRRNQIKATLRFQYTLSRMSERKTMGNIGAGEHVKYQEPSETTGGDVY